MERTFGFGPGYTKKDPLEDKGLLTNGDNDDSEDIESNKFTNKETVTDTTAAALRSEARIRKYMKGIANATGVEDDASGYGTKIENNGKSETENIQDEIGSFIDELEDENMNLYEGDDEEVGGGAFATQEEVAGDFKDGEFNAFFENFASEGSLTTTTKSTSADEKGSVDAGTDAKAVDGNNGLIEDI